MLEDSQILNYLRDPLIDNMDNLLVRTWCRSRLYQFVDIIKRPDILDALKIILTKSRHDPAVHTFYNREWLSDNDRHVYETIWTDITRKVPYTRRNVRDLSEVVRMLHFGEFLASNHDPSQNEVEAFAKVFKLTMSGEKKDVKRAR